jgi:hypothetical protein
MWFALSSAAATLLAIGPLTGIAFYTGELPSETANTTQ